MISRRRLLTAGGIAGACLLFPILTFLLVPDRELQGLASRALEREGYTLTAARIGKTLPPGLTATDLEIFSDKGPLVRLNKATARLRLLPLLTGRVTFACKADIGAARIRGDVSPLDQEFRIDARGVKLEEIPFFQSVADAQVKGALQLEGTFRLKGKGAGGELRLEVREMNLAGVTIGGTPLPDADFSTVRGMVRGTNGLVNLESFTLQGEGLYVRLKGSFPLTTPPTAAPLNLTLEMMPKPDFLEKQKLVFLLLAKYLVSPGAYSIPIKGTLAKPLIQ
jgi:type II secretion system protein N